MANYFDNQTNWSWNVSADGKVTVTTVHSHPKPHSHTLDVTDVPIVEMAENPGKVMGEAHRAATHEYQEVAMENDHTAKKVADEGRGRDDSFHAQASRCSELKGETATHAYTGNRAKPTLICEKTFPYRVIGKLEDGEASSKTVQQMRADLKTTAKAEQGQLSQNGQAVNNAGKTAAATPTAAAGKSASSSAGNSGHGGMGTGGVSGGHGTSGTGGSTGGHGAAGSGGGHGGPGTGSGGTGGGHGGSGGGSGGGHGGSGGGHGGH